MYVQIPRKSETLEASPSRQIGRQSICNTINRLSQSGGVGPPSIASKGVALLQIQARNCFRRPVARSRAHSGGRAKGANLIDL
jgi:hypothetical protein